MMLVLLVLGVLGTLVGILFGYVGYRMERAPVGPPAATRAAHPDKPLLVVLGDSHTHGRVGADWVDGLRGASGTPFAVANAGKNGDLAWNAAKRLPGCLDVHPEAMVLLIGSNDVMAADIPGRAAMYVRQKKLPQSPTIAWSKDQFEALLGAMKREVRHVAVCTIPPLGPDPDAAIEQAVQDWNRHVRDVASRLDVVVLDAHGALNPLNERGTRPYVGDPSGVLKEIMRSCGQRFLLGRSWDAIADRRGFGLTTDGIHLPERAGPPIVALVQGWLRTLDLEAPSG